MSCVQSIAELGNRGVLVEIECNISNNLPCIVIVGSASKAVDEGRERVRGAFTNSGLQLPRKRITINLAPADLPKSDSSFDLAMAAAILQTSGQIPPETLKKTILIGELGLDGSIRPSRGIIGKLLLGRKLGVNEFVVPYANIAQACLVPGVRLIPVRTLRELYIFLTTSVGITQLDTNENASSLTTDTSAAESLSLSEIVGQEFAKRGLEIAAAGGHNIFLTGPPGTGKSMLAKTLPMLLPQPTHEEILEVTQLHSLVTNNYEMPVITRPFRSPHHSASLVAILGGGNNLRPGEISLAHHGVLFLDEMPEFNRVTLEALRQPLEDHTVTVARAKDTVVYPANFILVATANPCPCGYYGSDKPCNCLPSQVSRYQQRISGPILDRIDLHCTVQGLDHTSLLERPPDVKTDATIRDRILDARKRQFKRYDTSIKTNATMSRRDIQTLGFLEQQAKDLLDQAAASLTLSARAYMKTVKVARTIADLGSSEAIRSPHIAEALQYRHQVQMPSL